MIEPEFRDGLLPVIVQDAASREVLMFAFMDSEAFRLTRETNIAHYYSRSRGRLWKKGETSGHLQHVKEMRIDCDRDCLLLLVDQDVAACHTGHRSCFYRTIDGRDVSDKVFEPEDVYGNK
jgi:phosphoribosyl-AMP cyclohydrolase